MYFLRAQSSPNEPDRDKMPLASLIHLETAEMRQAPSQKEHGVVNRKSLIKGDQDSGLLLVDTLLAFPNPKVLVKKADKWTTLAQ